MPAVTAHSDDAKAMRTMSVSVVQMNGALLAKLHPGPLNTIQDSAELSHSLKVLDRRRNTPKLAQNRSESLCASLWVPFRIFGLGLAQL